MTANCNDGSATNTAYVQYGSVRLHYCKVSYSGQAVDDPARRFVERTTIELRVEGYATPDMYAGTDGKIPSNLTQGWLTQELQKKGHLFLMQSDGGAIFQIRPADYKASLALADETGSDAQYAFIRTCVDRGPHPSNVRVTLMGAQSFYVVFTLSADVYGESVNEDQASLGFGLKQKVLARQVLSYYGTVGYHIDGDSHLQQRAISVTARFAREVTQADADDFRGILTGHTVASGGSLAAIGGIPCIGLKPPDGFKRDEVSVTVGPDEFTLQMQVRDSEAYATIPPPCTAGEATHEVSFGWWGAIYTATISGWFMAPPDVPKTRIIDVIMQIVGGRMRRMFSTGSGALNDALTSGAGMLFSATIRDDLFVNRIGFSFTYMGISWLAQFSGNRLGTSEDPVPQVQRDNRPDLQKSFFSGQGLLNSFGIGMLPVGSNGKTVFPGQKMDGTVTSVSPYGNGVHQMGGSVYKLWTTGGTHFRGEGPAVTIDYSNSLPKLGQSNPSGGGSSGPGAGTSTSVNDLRQAPRTQDQVTDPTAAQRQGLEFFWTAKRRYIVRQGVRQVPLSSRGGSTTAYRRKTVIAPVVIVVEEGWAVTIQPFGDPPVLIYPPPSLEWGDSLVLRQITNERGGGSAFPSIDGKVMRKTTWRISIMLTQEASAALLKSGVAGTSSASGGDAGAAAIWNRRAEFKNTPQPGPDGAAQDGGTTKTDGGSS